MGSRWVYTTKSQPNGEVKFKARLAAKGFTQVQGIDYEDTYCSVVHIMSTRLLLNYAAIEKLQIRQFDIKTAFLYAHLNEEIFLNPPEGYKKDNMVWKLKKSLYGLKQSPRMWNECFSQHLIKLGFKIATQDTSVFFKQNPRMFIIVYVDDGLVFADHQADIEDVLNSLKQKFKMREMPVNKYRGLEIVLLNDGIFIHQESYTRKVLETFNMAQAKQVANPVPDGVLDERPLDPNVPYRSAVSSLAYLSDTTRPDISFAVNKLQRKMASPTADDWKRAKYLMRYLVGTVKLGIKFSEDCASGPALIGYSDSDYAGDLDSSRSTTGYLILFNQAPIHWKSQLQRHVTLSSTEAEVIALCALSKQLAWMRRMLIELQIIPDQPAIIRCDNTSALKIVQNEKGSLRTMHLRAQDAFFREQVAEGELLLEHVKSDSQLADLLTKKVKTRQFMMNRRAIVSQANLKAVKITDIQTQSIESVRPKG